jgi:nucleoside-diphosphate-sugar epimerase
MGSLAPSPTMHILITGASGFIGQALAKALLNDRSVASLTLTDVSEPPIPSSSSSCSTKALTADLTDVSSWQNLVKGELTHVYLLHGIMSGAAEANLELGLRVNIDSMRIGLDVLRSSHPGIRIIFPSSLAVFGPLRQSAVVTEDTATQSKSSYGTQKAITEMLLNDYSRRGQLDGRIVRLPTIIVRPGQPSGAASSFCSGIIREPLNGERSVLPVDKSLKLWVCSTRTIIKNLLVARDIPASAFDGLRTVNLPGITVTVQEMLDALADVGGTKALSLIEESRDPKVEKIVGSWPALFDTTKAKTLGFQDDGTLANTVREYVEDYGSLKS